MEFNVDINFDDAQKAWRQNKKLIGCGGSSEYICGFIKPNGSACRAPPKAFKKQFRVEFKQSWSYCVKHS